MKRLVTHESLAQLGHLRNVLEQSGIRCLIKNEQLSGALGEIPFLECLPELWVVRDTDLAAAEALLRGLRQDAAPAASWICAHCGEVNEGQFAACWRCGAADEGDA
jgi:hypothetical protein